MLASAVVQSISIEYEARTPACATVGTSVLKDTVTAAEVTKSTRQRSAVYDELIGDTNDVPRCQTSNAPLMIVFLDAKLVKLEKLILSAVTALSAILSVVTASS